MPHSCGSATSTLRGVSTIWVLRPQTGLEFARIPEQDRLPNSSEIAQTDERYLNSSIYNLRWKKVLPAPAGARVLHVTLQGALVGTNKGDVYLYSHADSPKIIATAKSSHEAEVTAILHTRKASLYVATADGALLHYSTASVVADGTDDSTTAIREDESSASENIVSSGNTEGRRPIELRPNYCLMKPEPSSRIPLPPYFHCVSSKVESAVSEQAIFALTADSGFLYAGGSDGVVHIWELNSHSLLRQISVEQDRITCLLRAGPSALWVGYRRGVVRVLAVFGDDTAGIETLACAQPHASAVTSLVHVSADEVWSVAELDNLPPAAWNVRTAEFLGRASYSKPPPISSFAEEGGVTAAVIPSRSQKPSVDSSVYRDKPAADIKAKYLDATTFESARVLIELSRETYELVQLLVLSGPDFSTETYTSLLVPASPRFSPDHSFLGSESSTFSNSVSEKELECLASHELSLGYLNIFGDIRDDDDAIMKIVDEENQDTRRCGALGNPELSGNSSDIIGENSDSCVNGVLQGIPSSNQIDLELQSQATSKNRSIEPEKDPIFDAVSCSMAEQRRESKSESADDDVTEAAEGAKRPVYGQSVSSSLREKSQADVNDLHGSQERHVDSSLSSGSPQSILKGDNANLDDMISAEGHLKSENDSHERVAPVNAREGKLRRIPVQGQVSQRLSCGSSSQIRVNISHNLMNALSATLHRLHSMLPQIRRRQGPFGKELEVAKQLVELCVRRQGQKHSRAGVGDVETGTTTGEDCENSIIMHVVGLKNMIAKLKEEAAAAKCGYSEIRRELDRARAETRTLKTDLSTSKQECDALAKDLDDLQSESEMTLQSMEQKMNEQLSTLRQYKQEINAWESKYEILCSAISKLEVENDAKLETISSLERAHRGAENSLLEKTAEVAKLESQLEAKCSAENCLHVRGNLHCHGNSEKDVLTLSELKRELRTVENENEKLQVYASQVQGELETSSKALSAFKGIVAEKQCLLDREIESHNTSKSRHEIISKHLEEVQQMLGEERSKRVRAESIIGEQIPLLSDYAQSLTSRFDSEFAEMTSEHDRLQLLATAMKQQLEDALLKNNELRTEKSVLQEAIARTNTELEAMDELLKKTKGQLSDVDDENTLLRSAGQLQRQELEAGRSALVKKDEALKVLESEVRQYEERIEILSKKLSFTDEETEPQATSIGVAHSTARGQDTDKFAHQPGSSGKDGECGYVRSSGLPDNGHSLEAENKWLREELHSTCQALESQIDTTTRLAWKIADKEDACDELRKRIKEMGKSANISTGFSESPRAIESHVPSLGVSSMQQLETGATSSSVNFDGPTAQDLCLEMGLVRARMQDTCKNLKSAKGLVRQVLLSASVQAESLPILIELEEELRRQSTARRNSNDSSQDLGPAINVVSHVVSAISRANNMLGVLGLDTAVSCTPAPERFVTDHDLLELSSSSQVVKVSALPSHTQDSLEFGMEAVDRDSLQTPRVALRFD